MKSIKCTVTGLVIILLLNCNSLFANATIYQQLCTLNKEWLKITPNNDLLQSKYFESEQAIITYHLQQVENRLAQKELGHLDKATIERRKEGLAVLQAYWKRALYPKNFDYDISVPFFIDDNNTACAVGYIMQGTGNSVLAQEISDSQNNAFVKDIMHKDLSSWAIEYGFTADELAWIQPSYGPCWNGAPYFQENITQPTCGNNDGSISLIDYSNSDYTFEWETGGNSLQLNNLSIGVYVASGTYLDQYYGVECPYEYRYILDNDLGPELETSSSHQTCNGINDGTASVAVLNPTGSYNYEWSNGGTNLSIDNLSSGRHYTYVSDQQNCTSIAEAWVGISNAMYHYGSVSGSACDYNSGEIELTISGGAGTGNYNFQWNDGASTEDRNNISAGNYTLVVTDDAGCSIEIEKTVYDDCLGKIECEDDFADVNNVSGGFIDQYANDTDTSPAEITSLNIIQQGEFGWVSSNLLYYGNVNTNLQYYTYDQTYTGPDSFVYEVCTDYGFCDQATVYLNVTSQPTPNVVTAFAAEDFTICEGESLTLIASGAQTYEWTPTISLDQATGSWVTASPTNTTTYTITGSNAAGETATTTVTVEVITNTAALTSLPTTIGTNESPINLAASPSGGSFSGTGVVFSAFNPSIAGPGLHEISYEITDANGCLNTASQSVLVYSATFNFINYSLGTITPKIGEIQFETRTKVFGNYTVSLFDLAGKPIIIEDFVLENEVEQHNIQTNALPTGVYVLSLRNENSIYSKQIIISQ